MEYQKFTKLLGSTPDKVPRFVTKKWIEVKRIEEWINANDKI